ncbi:DUF6119 family protein, partial [Micromonospora sp. NPDC051196]|uniref:DUF6119 family protein n=1 Tax=Micromonospora sp. NPDC051196 TaxID=3155281 RepID=UPI0034486801
PTLTRHAEGNQASTVISRTPSPTRPFSNTHSDWNAPDPMSSLRVLAFFDGLKSPRKTSLLPYVVAEVELDGVLYAPCAGVWYQIDSDHLSNLNDRVRRIPNLTDKLRLQPWKIGENEGTYNSNALSGQLEHVVLDKKLFYSSGGRNLKVEVCDLLTRNRELICVKKMKDSANLSHLFAQGSVSARLFSHNQDYRKAAVQQLSQIVPNASAGRYDEWTVVFAIATDRLGDLADSMFFFSKINLDLAIHAIHGAGLRAAIAKIDLIN